MTTALEAFSDTADIQGLLDHPEVPALQRLMSAVSRLSQAPVAYLGLLGHAAAVATRIGLGTEYGKYLRTLPRNSIREPLLLKDTAIDQPEGSVLGPLRFVATAPVHNSFAIGSEVGVLVIADFQPRQNFSEADHNAIIQLATIVGDTMQLRSLACRVMESAAAFRESEGRLRVILDSIPALIICGGADGGCSFVNRSWQEFTGRSIEQELGDGWEESLHPEYREAVRETFWQAFERRQAFGVESYMRRYDGQYRWMAGAGVPRYLDDGTFAGFVSSVQDITDYLLRRDGLPSPP
jgi:PAS domain S-box-containing protein